MISLSPQVLVLLGTTFFLSALWAAVLLLLVRVRESEDSSSPRSHMGVELAWAVIPALLVLAVVLPALQSGADLAEAPSAHQTQVAEAR